MGAATLDTITGASTASRARSCLAAAGKRPQGAGFKRRLLFTQSKEGANGGHQTAAVKQSRDPAPGQDGGKLLRNVAARGNRQRGMGQGQAAVGGEPDQHKTSLNSRVRGINLGTCDIETLPAELVLRVGPLHTLLLVSKLSPPKDELTLGGGMVGPAGGSEGLTGYAEKDRQ